MSSNGTISIESHSKQVKLLNDYILSLEKKLNDNREQNSSQIIKMSQESNRYTEENVKLKNEISNLKFEVYKNEEAIGKSSENEKQVACLKVALEQ